MSLWAVVLIIVVLKVFSMAKVRRILFCVFLVLTLISYVISFTSDKIDDFKGYLDETAKINIFE